MKGLRYTRDRVFEPHGQRMHTRRLIRLGSALTLMLAVAVMSGCGGGGSLSSGAAKGHHVDKTVSFSDRYGNTTIKVVSAGSSKTVFEDFEGEPYRAQGTFVVVDLEFDSPILDSSDLLEVRGSDGLLYGWRYSNGPESGGYVGGIREEGVDEHHFTVAFDLPESAAKGAVLIIREGGTDRGEYVYGSSGKGREPQPGYEEGAHEIGLGL
jgi:hypothetical protein